MCYLFFTNRLRKAKEKTKDFILSAGDKKIVDKKLRALTVVPDFIRSSMVWFDTLPGRKKPKTADWLKVMRRCLPYVLDSVGVPTSMQALIDFSDILHKICEATCDFDPNRPDYSASNVAQMRLLQKEVVRALCMLELHLPESEFSIYIHEIVHMVDAIIQWSSPRNFWCFITERFVGYCKGFVKNRHLYMANLVCQHT